ncbi:MAG: hypothetical protein PUK54_03125 [Firmicutes bacterium]|nr:hypothetical protein [Bacillota bacterium]MDD7601587.1 hypothetical protein [Bacillota bacterium]MDY5857474.1 hypothetical protein [Anaerovoracaceae bacterium]
MTDLKKSGRYSGPYDDIIELPHPVSRTHPQMPVSDRAAQFAPFAALTGYEDAVKETARLTIQRPVLGEDARKALDDALQIIQGRLLRQDRRSDGAAASVTWFVPDLRKAGGSCVTADVIIKKIDFAARVVILADGTEISAEDILNMEVH